MPDFEIVRRRYWTYIFAKSELGKKWFDMNLENTFTEYVHRIEEGLTEDFIADLEREHMILEVK